MRTWWTRRRWLLWCSVCGAVGWSRLGWRVRARRAEHEYADRHEPMLLLEWSSKESGLPSLFRSGSGVSVAELRQYLVNVFAVHRVHLTEHELPVPTRPLVLIDSGARMQVPQVQVEAFLAAYAPDFDPEDAIERDPGADG